MLESNRLSNHFMPQNLDYVLFIDDFASKRVSWNEIWQNLPMDEQWREKLQLVDSGEMGILFSVTQDNP